MNIENFPLAWRWTSEAHVTLPPEILQGLYPLEAEIAKSLFSRAPKAFGSGAIIHQATEIVTTQKWLRNLPVTASKVTLVWNDKTALSMPWNTFLSYWSDFCYPSSDDVVIFLGEFQDLLFWHHYEVFEFKVGVL